LAVEVVGAGKTLQPVGGFYFRALNARPKGWHGSRNCYSRRAMTDTPTPVAELVGSARQGQRPAEAELCRRLAPAVKAFARRRLRGAEAIEEFTQDALLLMVEALREGRVEQPERLGGFVLGICRNLAHDRARQRDRRRALWEQYGAALGSLALEPEQRDTYDIAHLEDCLSQLSKRSRDLVRLGYVEALPHDEVAATLGISPANARVMRHRTLASLRECMSRRMSWEAA
jgi:RNA polymerase sigma-70 factor, ECF subfamily